MNAKRQLFIDTADRLGITSPINRRDVERIVEAGDGAFGWPSWITADKARRLDRGVFDVPELGGGSAPAPAPTAPAAPVATAPAPTAAKTVSPVATCDYSMMGSLVPSRLSTYVPWGHFKDVESIIRSGSFYPTFITGLSGNGKTEMVTQVCAKLKRECYRVNITRQTDEDDLLGGFRLINGETKFCYGPVVEAMRSGGVLLLDEIDLGGPNLMCLQSVLEGKGIFLKKVGEWITPAEGFTVVATANTKGKGSDSGNYAHTGIMNEAMLDRFPITLEQPYASRTTEKKILEKAGCDDKDFGDHLTKWAEIVRKAFTEGAVGEIISTRRLVDIVKANNIFNNKEKAIAFCLARFDEDTKEAFMSLYGKVDEQFNEFDAEHASSAASEVADDQKVPY